MSEAVGNLTLWHFIAFAGLAWIAWKAIDAIARRAQRFVCQRCGTVSMADARVTRGSLGIELVLWLCLIVPGLIYSLWRLSTKSRACPACRSTDVIPADSPLGRRLIAQTSEPPTTASHKRLKQHLTR